MKNGLFLLLCYLPLFLFAQAPKGNIKNTKAQEIFASTITPERIRRNLMVIASDAAEGREAGTRGIRVAAKYIENRLHTYGVRPFGKDSTYRLPFVYYREKMRDSQMKINGDPAVADVDFLAGTASNVEDSLAADEVVFVGYGIEDAAYNDYSTGMVRGKVLIAMSGEPKDKNGRYFLSGDGRPSRWAENDTLKWKTAKKYGAKAILIIKDKFPPKPKAAIRWQQGAGLEPEKNFATNAFISPAAAKKILGRKYKKLRRTLRKISKKKKPYRFAAKTKLELKLKIDRQYLRDNNIAAIVEGSDPKLKNEYVFMTAHLDHLGKRGNEIYNGADDDGSGSSSMIEIAHAFQLAKNSGNGPKRSVVFMWVSGEEKGLLGSRYYVEHPHVPLDNIVADVNIDMIGRHDGSHADPDYIYVIGADRISTELDSIIKQVNAKYTHLKLDYKYNEKDDPNRYYYRSDHYSFARKGIPVVFFFKGVHEDYHRPTDTIEKILFEPMSVVAKLAFHTLYEIANRDKRLVHDVPQ